MMEVARLLQSDYRLQKPDTMRRIEAASIMQAEVAQRLQNGRIVHERLPSLNRYRGPG
jgi:hypothetical protein